MKSTNWYIKLEDKWVYSEYNRVDDPDQIKQLFFTKVLLRVRMPLVLLEDQLE